MALSVIALVGSGCWIVGPIVLAAVAIVLAHGAALWQWNCFNRFNCRIAVLWRHAFRLLCGGLLFHSGGFLFHGPPRLRQVGCQRLGPVVLPLQSLPQFRRRALGRLL